MGRLEPWSAGRLMPNFLSADEAVTPEQVSTAYGAERYRRLAAVKKTCDPHNTFRINHNVRPA